MRDNFFRAAAKIEPEPRKMDAVPGTEEENSVRFRAGKTDADRIFFWIRRPFPVQLVVQSVLRLLQPRCYPCG